jgi:hypothetical protein
MPKRTYAGGKHPLYAKLKDDEHDALRWKTYTENISNVAFITRLLAPVVEEWKQATGKTTTEPKTQS